MTTFLLVSIILLWSSILLLGFLVLGALRALGFVNWRLDQLELTRPSRLGRDGLKAGKKAPDFTLPCAAGGEISLHDFAGRKVLLVFTQSGCGPCHDMAPEFNCVQAKGECQVLVVNNGEPDETRLQLALGTGTSKERGDRAGEQRESEAREVAISVVRQLESRVHESTDGCDDDRVVEVGGAARRPSPPTTRRDSCPTCTRTVAWRRVAGRCDP